jgi:hypothetical protein
MQDEWTKMICGERLVQFTYQTLVEGAAFITAQIAGHEVVYSVILSEIETPLTHEEVERHFEYELSKK